MDIQQSSTYQTDLKTTADHIINAEALKGKSVLITGATGTVGSYIADTLLWMNQVRQYGIRVILAGRNLEKLRNAFDFWNDSLLKYVQYDLSAQINFSEPADYIIHAAGNSHPKAFNSDPVGTIVNSVDSTKRLLDYGLINGTKRLLYVSSGEVYGQGDICLESFREDDIGRLDLASPRSCYPESKRAAENLCASYYSQYGLETVSVRLCHTYGPVYTEADSRAQVQFIRNALAHQNIELKSSGTQLRSYNYIADAAAGILTVLLNGTAGEAYNIANPDVKITIAGLAQIIAENENLKVSYLQPNAVDIANRSPIAKQVLNTEKLEKLGWRGVYSAETGISHTLRILHEMRK